MIGRKLARASKGRRPSPAFVISVIALVFAVGGGFAVAKKHSDAKSDKKIANKQITKRAPSLSVLHAKTADSLTNNTWFTALLNEDQTKVVASSSDFDVVAVCDDDASLSQFGNEGTALYIVQKSDNGTADTTDDEEDDFDNGEFVGFDFDDTNDGGAALNPDGHWVNVLGGLARSGHVAPGFAQDCQFTGDVQFG